MNSEERIERLERRLERERRARVEAEEIAERGMRDLWLANRELESRVRERTQELERSLLAARQAGEAKEAFLGDLGHDLATPLHSVLGHLDLVDRSVLSPDDRERLDVAGTAAAELATLLKGLVDLAASEGAVGPDELEPSDPATWLDALVDDWTRPAAARGQLIVPACRASGPVTAAWDRLRQVADLLLRNVTVHARPGQVRVEVEVDESERLILVVLDDGPGLDAVQLSAAVEPFVRFGDAPGLGIGLARADRLVRAAGGSLTLASPGAGTEVRVSLPCEHVVAPSSAS